MLVLVFMESNHKMSGRFGYESILHNGFDESISTILRTRRSFRRQSNNRTYLMKAQRSSRYSPQRSHCVEIRSARSAYLTWEECTTKFEDDGLKLDDKRRLDVLAIDFNTVLPELHLHRGGMGMGSSNIADTYGQQYGDKQHGGFVDIVQPVLKRNVLGFQNAILNVACRLEYVDWNVGTFLETGSNMATIYGRGAGVSFRTYDHRLCSG
jgi:hypothetical protein